MYILFVVEFSKLSLVGLISSVTVLEDPCADVVVVLVVKVIPVIVIVDGSVTSVSVE